jgi:hypothetical protein
VRYDLSKELDRISVQVKLNALKNKGAEIELKEIKPLRSLQANKYLHVCLALYGIEFGYTLEEVKTDMKRMCSFMTYEKNGKKFLRHTSKMQTDELTKFIEWIRTYSAQNGLYIPSADEYKINRISIDNEIERHKEWL